MSTETENRDGGSGAVPCYRATGLTAEEAEQGLRKLSEAAAKVPFPTRDELRLILMGAYRREWGILRVFHPGWWDAFLSR